MILNIFYYVSYKLTKLKAKHIKSKRLKVRSLDMQQHESKIKTNTE